MPKFRTITAVLALSTAPALAAPNVVTDIPAIGSLVQQVMGDLGQPEVLLEAGGNAHSYQLRPSQAAALQAADLLIWVGPELSPWLERAGGGSKAGSVALLGLDATHRQDFGDGAAHDHDDDHDHADDHAHEGEGEHDHAHDDHDHDHGDHTHDHEEHEHDDHDHDHDHSGTDPHAWLDPENARQWLTVIAAKLSEKDPENAAVYQENAARAAQSVTAAETEISAMLAPVRDKKFIVFHDAYGYFTGHFGLHPAISISLGDASTPSAARLAKIREQVAAGHPVCAFPEANHDVKLVETVIEGSDVKLGAPLDPAGATAEPGPLLYQDILRGMGKAMAECLSES
ncbi:MAG: zinc ABC transporter substrate-binding protein [Paracoccus sp. (in: a-proteobacteria)]|nr:zinc ABC transporter substrate-binding protein [Paracoccus sp. (in: a-proteobacteria)]